MNKIRLLALAVPFAVLIQGLFASSLLVDKESSFVNVDVEVFPAHSFTAKLLEYDATLSTSETGEIESAQFSFQFEDLNSNHKGRDKKMRKWMDIKNHPDVEFSLSSIEREASETFGVGKLWMHGVTKEIRIPISFEKDEDNKAILNGSISIDHRDWGLEAIRLLIFKVNPEITIQFKLSGELKHPSYAGPI